MARCARSPVGSARPGARKLACVPVTRWGARSVGESLGPRRRRWSRWRLFTLGRSFGRPEGEGLTHD
jgi:hypothetical protein